MQASRLLTVFFIIILFTGILHGKEPVIIDTDTTAFNPLTIDLEDDIAVIFAMADPHLDIKGLTITFGNGTQCQTYKDALHLVGLTSYDIPVLAGADWTTRDINRATPASEFIIDTALSSDHGITIIALGAMTNVAAAIVEEPAIVHKINRIVMMGGSVDDHWLELNFTAHGEATNIVFNSPVPKVVLSTEVTIQSTFKYRDLWKVRRHPDTVINKFSRRMESYIVIWSLLGPALYPASKFPDRDSRGFFLWDTISVAYVTHPFLFEDHRSYYMQMIDGKLYSEVIDNTGDHMGKVTVPMMLDSDAFKDIFMDHVLSVECAE